MFFCCLQRLVRAWRRRVSGAGVGRLRVADGGRGTQQQSQETQRGGAGKCGSFGGKTGGSVQRNAVFSRLQALRRPPPARSLYRPRRAHSPHSGLQVSVRTRRPPQTGGAQTNQNNTKKEKQVSFFFFFFIGAICFGFSNQYGTLV